MTGRLTTTSYCLLGLLDLRPFSAYDLTKYMQRSALASLWPRTEAATYREAKRLADAGLASVTTETEGKRPRSVYRITPAGRSALRTWLTEPGDPLSFECEAAVKAFFGTSTDLDAVRAQLQALRREFRTVGESMEPVARAWLDGDLPFPDRLHYTAMAADLIARVRLATDAWAADWLERLDQWTSPHLDEATEAQARTVIEGVGALVAARLTETDR
jgi:DNA-binding PadR family transcriptional regulator